MNYTKREVEVYQRLLRDELSQLNTPITVSLNAIVDPTIGASVLFYVHQRFKKIILGNNHKRKSLHNPIIGIYVPEICPSTVIDTSNGLNGHLHYHGGINIPKNLDKVKEFAHTIICNAVDKYVPRKKRNGMPQIHFGSTPEIKWANYSTKKYRWDYITMSHFKIEHTERFY
ncbi:hypothetical protein LNTAR_25370 [Lentisphaera araneosa HTCC2155]|uniref:Uncharacterized protein n=1 Tax=Lentisphaera araneosa HTCC2155 TaxID=313628 RepID=A6DSB6_9BACT|nr:hypothetical protein [Lentisphaera araneosa]EDM25461.1 hypothetical protein LNTAR_25370 [Lentisphaera araneosa HTCC2155]